MLASYYISIEKKNNKGSQMGHTKKYLKKNIETIFHSQLDHLDQSVK
jgi:hypothetical protein